jgi:RND family efflux transporter MFP subunit
LAGFLLWQLQPQTGFDGGAGGGIVTAVRTAPVDTGRVERTVRLTGTTQAERYISIDSPRMRGSRSRRGASAGGSVGIGSRVTVSSTSSVSSTSTMSSLGETGSVATSSGAASAGGGLSRSSTSRISGSSGSGSVIVSRSATPTSGGSGGGYGGPRGDFTMVVEGLLPSGTRVQTGDVIAYFDNQYMATRVEDYVTSVTQYEANFAKSSADIDVTRRAHDESIEVAKAKLEKAELDVKTIPVLSAIQAERTRLALEEAQAEYDRVLEEAKFKRISEDAELQEAQYEVKEARVELDRARANLDKLQIKAPMEGMVVRLSVFRNGEMGVVKEGDEVHPGQPFVQVVDLDSMVIAATVNQVDAESLRIGQKARVRFDAFSDLELPATVFSIGTVAKARQYRQEFVTEIPVMLRLDETADRVIPDLSVSADVIVGSEKETTMVPLGAVFEDAETGRSYVWVRDGDGWERREVELGLRSHINVAIRSGLHPGEEVAMEPPADMTS